jgi:hypothetical protein
LTAAPKLKKSDDEYVPSVFTPFFRRFTDERARDAQETRELYERVRARYVASPYSDDDAVKKLVLRLVEERLPYTELVLAFCVAMDGVCQMEDSIFGFPDADLDHLALKEQVELNRLLRAKDYFFAHETTTIQSFEDALVLVFSHIAELLPKTLAPSPFVIPLAYALPDPKRLIDDILGTLWREEYKKNALFVHLTRQLYFNLCEVSGIADPFEPKRPLIHASKNDAPIADLVEEYLKGTPLRPFFEEPVPLQLTHEERFSHMHVVGGSGAGKTQLLQSLILHDLTSEDRPALVVVDSQGDLINKLLHLELDGYEPILISPKDTPALNVFDVKNRGYGEYEKEQVTAGVIQTLEYLFTGFGIELTGKMQSLFRPMCRLMLALPETMGRNATLIDIIRFTDKPETYLKAIEHLPEIQRSLFERDILDPKRTTYKETREQIRYRLQALLDNPTLARLFTSEETKLDIFKELNEGSVILVDTAKDFLKGASGHFGQIFISLVLQAILERAVIPEEKRTHTFLLVDEAAEYFDTRIDDLLTEARKYKCGLVLAHQFLDQCTPQLHASLMANTAIKMAGSVSHADARAMAAEMRTTPDFILSQPRLHFACHIRNVTPQAVSIPVAVGTLERQPKLSEESFDELIARNRERVGAFRYKAPQGAPPRLDAASRGTVGAERPSAAPAADAVEELE